MFMSIAGAMVIGLLTGTFYYCSEVASKESTEGEGSPARRNHRPPPKRPPRKRRNVTRRFDNGEGSSFISSRSTTSESSIGIDHGHATTKVVTARIEKHPNETSSQNDKNLNLLRSVLSSFDADLPSDESALRGSEQRSFVTSSNDNTEKALARKTLNNVTSQDDETERYYLNIPPISSSNLRPKDSSIDRSMFQINPTIDAFTSTKIICPTHESYNDSYNGEIVYEKSFYIPDNEKNESNDSENDNALVVRIRLRKSLTYIKNNKNSRSKDFANKSSFHTTNLTTTDYENSRSKEYLLRKKRSEKLLNLFQCHK